MSNKHDMRDIRNIGYLKWRDSLAWMEKMKGEKWQSLIKKESRNYNLLAHQPYVEKLSKTMKTELTVAAEYSRNLYFNIGCYNICVYFNIPKMIYWRWTWDTKLYMAHDIEVSNDIVWYSTSDINNISGDKNNRLICQSSDNKILWKKDIIISQIAIKGAKCYYIKTSSQSDANSVTDLCVCDALTGRHEKVLFRQLDTEREIILIKGANKSLYLKSNNTINSKVWKIHGETLKRLDNDYDFHILLGEDDEGNDCRLVKKDLEVNSKWLQKGKMIKNWIFPKNMDSIYWVNIYSGHVLTAYEGTETLWYCTAHKQPQILYEAQPGTIVPNKWAIWEKHIIQSFCIKTYEEPPYIIHCIGNSYIKKEIQYKPPKTYNFCTLEAHKYYTASKDGTEVPYIIIHERNMRPKCVLVYVYGAYGSTTSIGWPQLKWGSLLKRGWAISYAMVRGGGDKDDKWADNARRENRIKAVEDYEAVIKATQKILSLTSKQTVLYGRSAGGMPVGAVIARHPDGHVASAAFTEVPYVDPLRTTTNPNLPLTMGEYEEFGNPVKRIQNFKGLLDVSPINTLPCDGAPSIFVLDRVGLKDWQVYAYESFKWVQHLRGYSPAQEVLVTNPHKKYIGISKTESHHYREKEDIEARSTDLAILDAWMENKLRLSD